MSSGLDHNGALTGLIRAINASESSVILSADTILEWQDEVLEPFLNAGLLSVDMQAGSIVCDGCENHCYMPVQLSEDARQAFIVCDHPDQQSTMGRLPVDKERLRQWESSVKCFASTVARLLELDDKPIFSEASQVYQLGMLKGAKGRRAVSLSSSPMNLMIKDRAVALEEIIYFEGGILKIDFATVDELLNKAKAGCSVGYTPNVDKRESRKLATQSMYQDWRDAYQKLSAANPGKSDSWCAVQIAKMDIAQGKSEGTIRKNMK